MARQIIDTDTQNPGWVGDIAKIAFTKTNENFGELYAVLGSGGVIDARIPAKNLLINGNMRVLQRGNSGTLNNTEVFGPDRWKIGCLGGVTCNWGVGQAPAGTLGNSRFFLGYNVVAGASAWIGQKVEGVLTIHGDKATFSFLMRSTPAGRKVGIRLIQDFGTGGSPSGQVVTEVGVVTLGGAFEPHSVTFDVPSVSGKTFGSSGTDYLYLLIDFSGSGHGGQISGQTGLFEFSEAQLERGSKATAFEHVPMADEVGRCQRYFQKSYDLNVVPGTANATAGQDTFFFYGDPNSGRAVGMTSRFATRMRGIPAVTIYSPATGAAGQVRSEAPAGDYVGGVNTPGQSGFFLTTVAITTNNTNVRWHWAADAEL